MHCGGVCGALQHNNIKLQHARPQHCEIEGRDTHIPDGDGELAEVVHKQVGVRVRLFEAPVEVVFNDTTPTTPHHTTPNHTNHTTLRQPPEEVVVVESFEGLESLRGAVKGADEVHHIQPPHQGRVRGLPGHCGWCGVVGDVWLVWCGVVGVMWLVWLEW